MFTRRKQFVRPKAHRICLPERRRERRRPAHPMYKAERQQIARLRRIGREERDT